VSVRSGLLAVRALEAGAPDPGCGDDDLLGGDVALGAMPEEADGVEQPFGEVPLGEAAMMVPAVAALVRSEIKARTTYNRLFPVLRRSSDFEPF